MGRTLTWVLFVLALLLLVGSLSIHVATYLDLALTERWPFLWVVYILGFALFVVVLADAQARTQTKGKVPMFTAFEPGSRSLAEAVAAILLIYALGVFMIGFLQPSESNATRSDGRPVISKQGKVIRQLDEREYAHIKALEMRGISAMFLCFVGWDALELFSMVLLEERKHAARVSIRAPLGPHV